MKKVLIITYYWPPSGGSGVQRWAKTVKYLRDFGWEPVIYTAENGEYPVIDESLEKEIPKGIKVIRTPIWEPYSFYKKFTGQKKNERVVSGFLQDKKPGLKARMAMWIRGNVFIPDARKFWIRPSVKYLTKYLSGNKVDLIVSTGPPHSMHMIALGVHEKTKIPWLADFRDPWTNIDFYRELMLSPRADRKHHSMEKKVITTANEVVVVGKTMKGEFEAMGAANVKVITNGYDETDIPPPSLPDEKFSIVHIGLMNQHRNHPAFWEALADICAEDKAFKKALEVKIIGKADVSVRENVNSLGLQDNVTFIDYMPHKEAVGAQSAARVLYLSINNTPNAKGVITGKIFEYLASRRPIFCIGPEDGDAAEIITNAEAGRIAGFENKDKIKADLLYFYSLYLSGELETKGGSIEKYSRKELARVFAVEFNRLCQ